VEQVAQSEAAALFLDRASAVQPDVSLTRQSSQALAEICRRLDGIPLGIELAAARTKHLTIEQIAERLDDRFRLLTTGSRSSPTRQQTLRAAIDWSYQLLSEPERLVFDRFSVFAGGWTLEAAEAVAADNRGGISRDEVLNLIGRLVDKSLVVAGLGSPDAARYRMLETLRAYGQEHLARRGPQEIEATARRRTAFFTELAEQGLPTGGSLGKNWLHILDREHDNFRVVLHRHVATAGDEQAQRLAGALATFWLVRGHLTEGRDWLKKVLGLPLRPDGPGSSVAIDSLQARTGSAQLHDRRLAARARALHGLGLLAFPQGEYELSRTAYAAALELWHQLGDESGAAYTLPGLGLAELRRGDLVAARGYLEAGVSAATSSQKTSALALSLAFLARVEQDEGDLGTARTLAEQALSVASEAGYTRAVCIALVGLGDVAYQAGEYSKAREFLLQATARGAGDPFYASFAMASLGRLSVNQHDLSGARDYLLQSLRLALSIGQGQPTAHALESTAALAVAVQHPVDALLMAGAAAAMRKGLPLRPFEREMLMPCLELARSSVGAVGAAKIWADAKRMSLDEATAGALQFLERLRTTL
jgi:non-specific serine/threonine protein kinase